MDTQFDWCEGVFETYRDFSSKHKLFVDKADTFGILPSHTINHDKNNVTG